MKKRLFIIGFWLISSAPAFAKTIDTQLPIQLQSMVQDVDVTNNVTTLIGKVDIVQGNVDIKADRAVIKFNNKTRELKSIEVYGKPAYFKQIMDDGKIVNGQALYGIYLPNKNTMIFKQDANVDQDGNKITASEISYNLLTEIMKATGSKTHQVKTVLLPESKK